MSALKWIIRTPLLFLGYDIHRVSLPGARPEVDEAAEGRQLRALGITKAHYGCGANYLGAGWLNMDFRAGAPAGAVYRRVDLTERHPFPDNFFDFGFSEDFLEHLGQEHSLRFLIEAHRTLKPGGVLRLSFPGMEGVLRKHYIPPTIENAAVAMVDAYTKWGHRHFYSKPSLELVARHVGYRGIEFRTYGESDHAALRDLEQRSQQTDMNTYAELTK